MAKHRVRPAGLLADEGLGDEAVPSFERKKAAATIAPKKPATAKPRKLSKKAAVAAQYSDADSCRTHVSQWLAKAGAEIAAKHGGDLAVHVAGKEHELIRGIPFPHLCLEYLFQNSVLPIGGRVTQVVGPPGSCKTALAIEIGRWFVDAGGVVIYCEHESKYSPDWAPSILGWERQNSFMLHKCHSINEWQSALLDWSKQIQKMMYGEPPKNPGPGAVFPVLNIVDSIMGKSMEESQSRVLEAGHAGRDHPVEASSITKFMRTYPQQVALWPFHLVMVNHLRVSKDEAGLRVRDKPGGWQKDFQETFEVESTPIAQTHLADSDGVRLQLKTYKNSLGTKERWIEVNVRWWEEDDPTHPGKYRLKTEWDWPEATLLLLAEQLQPESRRNRVKNILDLKFPNKTSRTVYSKRLGIKKDNPVSYEEAVAKISADAELMQSLRRALGVKQYPVFIPGMDFREQMLGSKAAAAAAYKAEIERNAAKAKKKPKRRRR